MANNNTHDTGQTHKIQIFLKIIWRQGLTIYLCCPGIHYVDKADLKLTSLFPTKYWV